MDPVLGASLITGGAGILDNILGGGRDKRSSQMSFEQNVELMNLGNAWDMQNQKEMFDYRIGQATKAGLSPYEAYLGPAGGAGGGTSGSGASMGNNQTAINSQKMQMQQRRSEQLTNIGADIAKTKMQTDAQLKVAEMQTGATTRGQDIDAMIRAGKLKLDAESVQIAKDKLIMEQQLQPARVEKAVNEAASTAPKFLKYMKYLTMGADNMLATMLLGDNTLEQIANDPTKREQFVTLALAYQSQALKEASGLKMLADQAESKDGASATKDFRTWLLDFLGTGNESSRGLTESTPGPRTSTQPANLGNTGSAPNFGITNPHMRP